MNYLTEIRLFYEWLETHQLTPYSISLWHAILYTASRAGWPRELPIPVSILMYRTQMGKTSLYRARDSLVEHGLIDVTSRTSSLSAIYRINSLEKILPPLGESPSVFATRTQGGTQEGTQHSQEELSVSAGRTHSGNIYGVNRDNSSNISDNSDNTKRKKREKPTKEKKFVLDQWAKEQESPWRELLLVWFDYKRTRKESYRNEMGAKKCLTMLRNLSGGNAEVAQRIIDQSMANNWAGLFALREGQPRGHPPSTRQYGQHIGQIVQSDDEQKRQYFIDKLQNAGNK